MFALLSEKGQMSSDSVAEISCLERQIQFL